MQRESRDGGAVALEFAFRLVGTDGRLTLSDRDFFGWLHVERLELEIPNLPLPIDLADGPQRFQKRRTRVRVATLRIDQRALETLISHRAVALSERGLDQLSARCRDDGITCKLRARDGARAADVTFRLVVTMVGTRLRVLVEDARTHGYLSVPAPLIAHEAVEAVLAIDGSRADQARAPGLAAEHTTALGLGDFEIEPLRAFLWNTMPPSGWRLPSLTDVSLINARTMRGAVLASYGPGDSVGDGAQRAAIAATLAARERVHNADQLVLARRYDDALRAYRALLAHLGGDDPFVVERILTTAAAHPPAFVDAEELARAILGRWPEFPSAHAALAAVAVQRGDINDAASRYEALANTAAQAGADEAAVASALAGARILRSTDSRRATPLYELVIDRQPGHAEAIEALLERYAQEGRHLELTKLIRSRLALTTDAPRQARDHVRIAEILAGPLDDGAGALDELDRAIGLDRELAVAHELRARVLEQQGNVDRAAASIAEVARICAGRGDTRGETRAHLRAGALWDRANRPEESGAAFDRALALDPDSNEALVGAAKAASLRGDNERAVTLLACVLEVGGVAASEAAAHHLALGRALIACGELGRAEDELGHAAAAGNAVITAEALSLLAELAIDSADETRALAVLASAIETLLDAARELAVAADADAAAGDALTLQLKAAELSFAAGDILARQESAKAPADPAEDFGDILDEEFADGAAKLSAAEDAYRRTYQLASGAGAAIAADAAERLASAARGRGQDEVERKWIDAFIELAPADAVRAAALIRRAELQIATAPTAARADLDAAAALTSEPRLTANALAVRAKVCQQLGAHYDRAVALEARAELVEGAAAITDAHVDVARAWLEADEPTHALDVARVAEQLLETAGRDYDGREVYHVLADAAWRARSWDDCFAATTALVDLTWGAERGSALHRLAASAEKIGDLDRAIEAYREVASDEALEPSLRAQAARAVADVLESKGRDSEAAAALETFASLPGADDTARADGLFRAAELHRRSNPDSSDLERCLEGVLELAQDHLPTLDALEQLARRRGDAERVATILGRKVASTTRHPSRQKALLVRLAEHQLLALDRADVALASIERALEIDPWYRPALRFVANDARNRDRDEAAADALAKLASELPGDLDAPEEPAALVSERIEAALALTDLVFDGDPALRRMARDTVAGLVATNKQDARLLAALERLDPGAAIPEQVDDVGTGPSGSPRRRHAAPTLHGEELARRDSEQAAARDANDGGDDDDDDDPEHLRSQAERAASDGDSLEQARYLERLARALPAATGRRGRSRRAEVFLELADLYYDLIDDASLARRAMRDAADELGEGMRRDATLRMLASEAASARSFDDAIGAYEAISVERRTPADRFNLARCHQRMGHEHRAIEVLESARADAALTDEGAMLLFALQKDRQRKRELAASLERGAAEVPAAEAVIRLHESLQLYRDALGDLEATERVSAILDGLGELPPALATSSGVPEQTENELTRPPVPASPEDLLRLARGAKDSGDSKGAAELATEGALMAIRQGAHSEFEAIVAELRELPTTPIIGETIARMFATAGRLDTDTQRCAQHFERAGSYFAIAGQPDDAETALAQSHSLAPDNAAVFAALSTFLRARSAWPELIAAGELHADALAGQARCKALLAVAMLERDQRGDADRAAAVLEAAHAADAEYVPVWIPLAQARLGNGDAVSAQKLLERALETPLDSDARNAAIALLGATDGEGSPKARSAEQLRLAITLDTDGHLDAALAHYESAAALDPTNVRALDAIDQVYAERGNDRARVDVLARLISATADPDARATLWMRRARLCRDVLHEESETYRSLKEAHANAPDNADAAYALRSIAMARGEWALAAELLYREIAAAATSRERGALHLELAMIFDERLHDADEARLNYEQALELDPDIPAAPAPLARLHELGGNFAESSRMFATAAERVRDDDERGRLYHRAALTAERAGLDEDARRYYHLAAVLAQDPGESETAQSALARLDAISQPDARDELLELRLRETADPEDQVEILRQLLQRAQASGNPGDINRHARALLEVAPVDATAYLALKAVAESERDTAVLSSLLSNRAQALTDPNDRAATYFELGRLRELELHDLPGAVAAYELALASDDDHPAALEMLAEIAYRRHEWHRAHNLYRRIDNGRSALAPDALAYRRGEIAEALGIDSEALDQFSRAAELEPSNRSAHLAVVRSALRAEHLDIALRAAKSVLELLSPDDVIAISSARLQIAELAHRSGDIVDAIHHYEMVIAEDGRSRPALYALVELYTEAGDEQGAVRSLRTLASIATSSRERAEHLFQLGEHLAHGVGDHVAAADAWLRAIDLDPAHQPTLRRLIDHYTDAADWSSVRDMANGLAERNALCVAATPRDTIGRAMLAGAIVGAMNLATTIAAYLGEETPGRLADALLEAEARGQLTEAVRGARDLLRRSPLVTEQDLHDALRQHSGLAPELIVAALAAD